MSAKRVLRRNVARARRQYRRAIREYYQHPEPCLPENTARTQEVCRAAEQYGMALRERDIVLRVAECSSG
jgi:hypothetical protein